MKKETVTALKKSIAHWKRLLNEETAGKEKPYSAHCALCKRFGDLCRIKNGNSEGDERCPVYAKTGCVGCCKSPWQDASRAWWKHVDFGVSRCYFEDEARKEIEFLKSLLPAPVKPKRVRKSVSGQEVADLLLSKKLNQKKLLKLRTFINHL